MSAGPDEEFDGFMRARWPAMVQLGYALTGDAGHAEDLAQAVGNNQLFAVAAGTGAGPTGWATYDAAGHQIGAGSVASASATAAKSAKP